MPDATAAAEDGAMKSGHLGCVIVVSSCLGGFLACEGDNGGGGGVGTFDAGSFDGATSSGGGDGGASGSDGSSGVDGAVDNESHDPVLFGNASSVKGAASDDGSAMLVFVLGSQLSFARYEPATGWSTQASIPGVTTTTASDPQVAMDASGNAFVAWYDFPGGVTRIEVVRYEKATSSWGAVESPDAYADNVWQIPALSVNKGGDALLLSLRAGAAPRDINVQHFSAATKAWTQEPIVAVAGTPNETGAHVVLGDDGRAVMAGVGPTGGYVIATRSTAGAWTVEPRGVVSGEANLAMNAAGDVVVGYQTQGTQVYAYRFDAATATWSDPVQLPAEAEAVHYGSCPLTTGVAPNGDAQVLLCHSPNAAMRQVVTYAFTKSTGTWGAAVPLVTSGWPYFVRTTFDAQGKGSATWLPTPTAGSEPAPLVGSTFSNGTWTAETAITTAKQLGNQDVFTSPSGRTWAAWLDTKQNVTVAKIR